jgi:hypothetical protein
MRKVLIALVVVLVGLIVISILSERPDATARAKMSEVRLYMSTAQGALAERCDTGTLTAGMTHATLGFPDPYKPGPLVQRVTVRVDSPKRLLVTATLADIYSEFPPFWKSLAIPSGTSLVLEGSCEDRMVKWRLGETTIPPKYLPASLQRGSLP